MSQRPGQQRRRGPTATLPWRRRGSVGKYGCCGKYMPAIGGKYMPVIGEEIIIKNEKLSAVNGHEKYIDLTWIAFWAPAR